MLDWLRRHHFPVSAFFERSLVLTFAFPEEVLRPLLAPGLSLDGGDGLGYAAVALVQTRRLRPAGWPTWLGLDFFLTGYRIFARYRDLRGRNLRGLRILRSDTDRRLMVWLGNLLTHYAYHKAELDSTFSEQQWNFPLRSDTAPLKVAAFLESEPELPAESPFRDWREARKWAGPLPFTFDYERSTDSMVIVEGVRQHWEPRPVRVELDRLGLLEQAPFSRRGKLAAAFVVERIDYRWKRGIVEKL